MAFQYPAYLQAYLDKKKTSPFQTYVNTSQYYAQTDVYLLNYMDKVVRQCMAYATGTQDGAYNYGISTNVAHSMIKTAVKIVRGEKTYFNGDDEACAFLSDIWTDFARFDLFVDELITYTMQGGTALLKINRDAYGRCTLSASRIDRNRFTVNDAGNIVEAVFFITLLASTKNNNDTEQLWLVEHRYYEEGKPYVEYKVHRKAGIAGNETLPPINSNSIPLEMLPDDVRRTVQSLGIQLGEKSELPFRDGLGVWLSLQTSTNSCVPGLRMGDPALYGILDLLWALDTVFSGSIIDVLNGQGIILCPKHFLEAFNEALQAIGQSKQTKLVTHLDLTPPSEQFVYVSVEGDETFKPEQIQFDIRSEKYAGMWELYLRQIAVSFGYAPTTLFPYLQDNSPKTAREVTAEENLTRATVQSAHRLLLPELNRAIAEVLYQSGFSGKATVALSDYIGNKLMRDENIRLNKQAGLIPNETAVQIVNGLTVKETHEYIEKINEEKAQETARNTFGQYPFNDSDYYNESGVR
jgi:hypothetical protein